MNTKKLISLLLTLAMALGMLPAMTVSVAAEDDETPAYIAQSWKLLDAETVYVNDSEALRYYLSDPGAYNIVLSGSCCTTGHGYYDVWCQVNGTKSLNLNGCTIYLSNNKPPESTMFSVSEGAYLELYDASGGSWINYDGYIAGEGSAQVRNIFEVKGTLVLQSGTIEAGRSKSARVYSYAALHHITIWRQIIGNGVTVQDGGLFIMNGGEVYGRGRTHEAVIGRSCINGGALGGFGGASPTSLKKGMQRGGYYFTTSCGHFADTLEQSEWQLEHDKRTDFYYPEHEVWLGSLQKPSLHDGRGEVRGGLCKQQARLRHPQLLRHRGG